MTSVALEGVGFLMATVVAPPLMVPANSYPGQTADYEHSFATWKSLPCTRRIWAVRG